uniref:heat shock cognate 71 kDa protein-like n=1 Tax=Styela clava TaxID=7725 RepID=UPI00193AC6D9|nr:heat shock cognate 71 kDa protein-like [Styela clava]
MQQKVEIIEDIWGNRVTPSYVSFTMYETLVGEEAKEEETTNYENTPCQQISAMILKKMKDDAETFLGEIVTDAVITVPAYFNDAQRKATRDAGLIAGLNVIGMINEPTAAAVAYGLDRQSDNERNVLIFELGEGTFDVTIVNIKGRKFDVEATGGDTHLGGEDFVNNLVEYFVSEFKKQHGEDISENKIALNRLRVACEAAERNLFYTTITRVQIDALHGGGDFRSCISREEFENLNSNLFRRMLDTVKNTLSDSGLKKENFDDVVLVGGSARIPKIQEMLEEYFDNMKLKKISIPTKQLLMVQPYMRFYWVPTKILQ